MEFGSLELSATRGTAAVPGEPVTEGVTFILAQDDPDAPQGRREVARSAAPAPSFTLPAGPYYVTVRTPSAEVREQIAIGAGDVVKRAMPLSLAHIKLAATLGGQAATVDKPVTYRVVRLDGTPREVARTIAPEPEFDLSAGRYRLEATLGASNVIAATEIALAAGQAQKITLPLEGGGVTLRRDKAGATTGDVYLGGAGRKTAHRAALQPAAGDGRARPRTLHRHRRNFRAALAQRHRSQSQRAPHL